MSVEEQRSTIATALHNQQWAVSEDKLRKLHEDINFLNPAEIYPFKSAVVEDLEDTLYTRIDRVSRYSINKFLEENVNTLENIDSLYADSVSCRFTMSPFLRDRRNSCLSGKLIWSRIFFL